MRKIFKRYLARIVAEEVKRQMEDEHHKEMIVLMKQQVALIREGVRDGKALPNVISSYALAQQRAELGAQ